MSSNNNYYEFKDAKVAIAMELVKEVGNCTVFMRMKVTG